MTFRGTNRLGRRMAARYTAAMRWCNRPEGLRQGHDAGDDPTPPRAA